MYREARFDIQSLRPKYGAGGKYSNKRTRTRTKKSKQSGPPRLDYRSYHIYEGKYAKFYFPIGLVGLLIGLIGMVMWLTGVPFRGEIVSTVGVILFIVGTVGVIISISIASLTGGTWYRSDDPLPSGVKYEEVIWINRPDTVEYV